MYFVYLLLCADDSVYTGITTDVARRFEEHAGGKRGAKFTRAKEAVRVLYVEEYPDRSEASKREAQIKKLPRHQKLTLAGYTGRMIPKKGATVEAYVAAFPPKVRTRLKALRSAIRSAAPKAEEKMAYGMPGYKLSGKPLMYFGGFKEHVSLFPMPGTVTAFKKELQGYVTAKSAIRFPHDTALPMPLIRKLIAYRVKQALPRKK